MRGKREMPLRDEIPHSSAHAQTIRIEEKENLKFVVQLRIVERLRGFSMVVSI